jgi:mannose-6-phosphate isomerase-like protein (cupin superfamily)
MAIAVHDYHAELTNIGVQPEIRSRFRRVELGPVPDIHSHDLGGETFLVMEGQIEFTVAHETVVCGPGQSIYVPPRTTHAVRAVGEHTGVIYLSVSPHVEPTHTFYDANGGRLPPRYGVWRAAGGGEAESELARQNADVINATPGGTLDASSIKPTVDQLWERLRPVLEQVEAVERAWNELALRAAT